MKTLIYGRHPVIEAIKSGNPLDKVLLQQDIRGEMEKEIRQLCKLYGIPLQVIPKERIQKITTSNHQGVLAYLSLIQYYQLNDVLPGLFESDQFPLVLILDGITDVRNFGAIARTAEGAGVGAIVIPGKNSAAINSEALKTSAGALTRIPVCRELSLVNAVKNLKDYGFSVLVGDLTGSKPIYQLDLNKPLALILGSEESGVQRSLITLADDTFILPQRGTIDSYNVSVAAGMMLYEVMRQQSPG
jgi:23S rRNA (guanosine2251-2'-O)-methyltransferase